MEEFHDFCFVQVNEQLKPLYVTREAGKSLADIKIAPSKDNKIGIQQLFLFTPPDLGQGVVEKIAKGSGYHPEQCQLVGRAA